MKYLQGRTLYEAEVMRMTREMLSRADAGTAAYVRRPSPITLGFAKSGPPLAAGVLDVVRAVDGVDQASVEVSGYAQVVDGHGKAVGSLATGAVGMNWVTVPALNPFTLAAGRAPIGADEVAIDKHSADTAGLRVGDRTTVLSTGEPRPATIVGIARFAGVDTAGALSIVLFDDVTAQTVLGRPGEVTAIAVTARPGVSPDTLVARLAPVIGTGNEVISGVALTKEHQRQIGKDIGQFGTFLTIFALVAMFVGAFTINNTFSIIVSQRTKEMALLRAVGATGRQPGAVSRSGEWAVRQDARSQVWRESAPECRLLPRFVSRPRLFGERSSAAGQAAELQQYCRRGYRVGMRQEF